MQWGEISVFLIVYFVVLLCYIKLCYTKTQYFNLFWFELIIMIIIKEKKWIKQKRGDFIRPFARPRTPTLISSFCLFTIRTPRNPNPSPHAQTERERARPWASNWRRLVTSRNPHQTEAQTRCPLCELRRRGRAERESKLEGLADWWQQRQRRSVLRAGQGGLTSSRGGSSEVNRTTSSAVIDGGWLHPNDLRVHGGHCWGYYRRRTTNNNSHGGRRRLEYPSNKPPVVNRNPSFDPVHPISLVNGSFSMDRGGWFSIPKLVLIFKF